MRRNRHIYIPVINKLGCSRGIIAGQFLKAYWNISGNFIPPEKHQWCTLMRFCHYSAITLSFLPTSVFCMFCALFTRYQHIAVSLFSYYCFFFVLSAGGWWILGRQRQSRAWRTGESSDEQTESVCRLWRRLKRNTWCFVYKEYT